MKYATVPLWSLLFAACGYTVDTGPRTPALTQSQSSGESRPVPTVGADRAQTPIVAAGSPLPVGTELDPFVLQTPTQTLDARLAMRGGPIVLVFFLGEWCLYCRRQLTAQTDAFNA